MPFVHWLEVCLWSQHEILGKIASWYGVAMHLTILAQILKSLRRRSVEDLSVAVTIAPFVLFYLWVLYGVNLHNPRIYGPDIVGVILGGALIIIFAWLKQGVGRWLRWSVTVGIPLVWLTLVGLCFTEWIIQHGLLLSRMALGGSLLGHVAIAMQILKTVKRKTVEDIVWVLPASLLGSYIAWGLYGYSIGNSVLELSSSIGSLLGSVMLIQYLMYRNRKTA